MFNTIGRWVEREIEAVVRIDPWTNVYGVARSLLALSTFLTFAFTDVNVLFKPALDIDETPICIGVARYASLFCLLRDHLGVAKILTLLIMLVVLSGWRPRITGLLHCWICYSFVNSSLLVDGGDHVNMTLTSLLLPITLTDDRRWHWMAKEKEDPLSSVAQIRRIVARFSFSVIRIQVAVIYLHAAVAKCAVTEWQNGTAVYYWLTDPQYGVAEWLWPVVFPVLRNPFMVTAITWGSVALEFALFAGLIAKMRYRRPLLWMGIIFHVGIAVMHGLISFSISMIGALILFLRPLENEFAFRIPFSSGGTKNEPGSSTRVQEVTLA